MLCQIYIFAYIHAKSLSYIMNEFLRKRLCNRVNHKKQLCWIVVVFQTPRDAVFEIWKPQPAHHRWNSSIISERGHPGLSMLEFFWQKMMHVFSLGPSYRIGRVYKWNWSIWLCVSVRHHFEDDHWSWSLFLLIGFTDPYNHTSSESLWWKLFKNHKRTQIQRQTQWQRQRYRQSASKTQHVLYFWNPDDFLIPFQIWW